MSTSDNGSKTTLDQKAARQFLTELRTRISTQPLPYQHGVEARALESMWEVFAQARTAIKENPGCGFKPSNRLALSFELTFEGFVVSTPQKACRHSSGHHELSLQQ